MAVSSSNTNGLHLSGAPGLTPNGTDTILSAANSPTAALLNVASGKASPNLAQGVPPLLANQYTMGPGGCFPVYSDYYGVTFPGTAAAMPGRDGLANNPYSGEATKFGRNDSSSPAPPTSLSTGGVQSQPQQAQQGGTQGQVAGQSQGQQAQNQAFPNPPLPPGYGYTGLPHYAGMPAFQYGLPPLSVLLGKNNLQGGPGERNQSSSVQQKTQGSPRKQKTSCKKPEKGKGESYSTDCI